MITFQECASCTAKPGSPALCPACLHNRATIDRLVAAQRTTLDGWESSRYGWSDGDRHKIDALREEFGIYRKALTSEARPLVGISVLVMKQGKLLLGKRKGSHGTGEYACPGGHLEHLESFRTCAAREVLEETGIEIGPLRFLRVLNAPQYAPKHYVDLAFVGEWKVGEPDVREPDKVERWDWYAIDALPSPLFAMLPSAIAALSGPVCWDIP